MTDSSRLVPSPLASASEGYDQWADHYDLDDNPLVALATLARESLRPSLPGARVLEARGAVRTGAQP